MDYTENLSLAKPAKAEQYNIETWNANSDIIDAAFRGEVDTRKTSDDDLQRQIDENRSEERRIGTVPIEKGGTGATTAQDALNALHGSVEVQDDIGADAESTFIERTPADPATETPEKIDVKSVKLSDLASRVYELIRGDTAVFTALKNGLVPKAGGHADGAFLSATGNWLSPTLNEEVRNVASSSELTVLSNTILNITAEQGITLVINDGVAVGTVLTIMNGDSFDHTLSLKFYGGGTSARVRKGSIGRYQWTGGAWKNLAISSYNVGSLYWSSDSTDPKYILGGTWTQIKDRFVLAAGNTYTNGATGGASTVKLTESQLPAHTHSVSTTNTDHTHSGDITVSGGNHTHSLYTTAASSGSGGGMEVCRDGSWGSSKITYSGNLSMSGNYTTGSMSQNWSHSHTVNGGGNGKSAGDAHENMPPYIVKYCWERTA